MATWPPKPDKRQRQQQPGVAALHWHPLRCCQGAADQSQEQHQPQHQAFAAVSAAAQAAKYRRRRVTGGRPQHCQAGPADQAVDPGAQRHQYPDHAGRQCPAVRRGRLRSPSTGPASRGHQQRRNEKYRCRHWPAAKFRTPKVNSASITMASTPRSRCSPSAPAARCDQVPRQPIHSKVSGRPPSRAAPPLAAAGNGRKQFEHGVHEGEKNPRRSAWR
jgi:hypothetical protein